MCFIALCFHFRQESLAPPPNLATTIFTVSVFITFIFPSVTTLFTVQVLILKVFKLEIGTHFSVTVPTSLHMSVFWSQPGRSVAFCCTPGLKFGLSGPKDTFFSWFLACISGKTCWTNFLTITDFMRIECLKIFVGYLAEFEDWQQIQVLIKHTLALLFEELRHSYI